MQQQSPFKDDTLHGKVGPRVPASAMPLIEPYQARRLVHMQVAFITGGGSGIGFEIARQLGGTDGLAWSWP